MGKISKDKELEKKPRPYDHIGNIFQTLESNSGGHNIPSGSVHLSHTNPEDIRRIFNEPQPGPSGTQQKSKFLYPGHNYLGPGNTINEGEPIDTDDAIAREHDIAYNRARNNEDIFNADNIAIEKFSKDAYDTGNIHSVVGAVGLSAKHLVEKLSNKVIYPNLDNKQKNKLNIKNLISAPYNKDKPFGDLNISAFLSAINRAASNYARSKKFSYLDSEQRKDIEENYIRQAHFDFEQNIGSENYKNLFSDRAKKFPKERTLFTLDDKYKTYGVDPTENFTEAQIEEPITENSMTVPEEPIAKKARVIDDQLIRPPTTTTTETPQDIELTEDTQLGQIEPVVAPSGNISEFSKGMESSGGSGIAASKLQFYKAKGFHYKDGIVKYNNSFRMRSWGNVWSKHDGANGSGQFTITGMPILPVNYLCFYVPRELVNVLPMGTRVQHIKCKVTPIGQQVSFGTNEATNTNATIGHTLYGYASIGLNNDLPIGAFQITRNQTKPMEVAQVTHVLDAQGFSTFVDRIWQNSGSVAMYTTGVGHAIITPNIYLGIGDTSGTTTNTTIETSFLGDYPYNQHFSVFPLQPHTGTPIINFERECGGLCIAPDKAYNICREGPRNRTTPSGTVFCAKTQGYDQTALGWMVNNGNALNGLRDTTSDIIKEPSFATDNYSVADTYYNIRFDQKTIKGFDMNSQNSNGNNWPLVTFGVEPVQSNTPEGVPTYINASCDYYIETEIEFKLDLAFINMRNSNLKRYHQANNFGFQKTIGNKPECVTIPMYGYVTSIFAAPAARDNEDDYEIVENSQSTVSKNLNKNVNRMKIF